MLIHIDIDKPTRLMMGGGVTYMLEKRRTFKMFKKSMGYLGSSAVFSLAIFSSFNILASKILSFALVSYASELQSTPDDALMRCAPQLPVLLTSLIWLEPRNRTGYWVIAATILSKHAPHVRNYQKLIL